MKALGSQIFHFSFDIFHLSLQDHADFFGNKAVFLSNKFDLVCNTAVSE